MTDYILAYYQQIKDGTIVVGRWILLWYEYIIRGLAEKRFFFDGKKASRAIVFVENFCRHHEGALGGKKIVLELWQKAFLSVVFGIVDDKGLRQFREVVLIVARKNGKTLFAAAIAAYCTFLDGEYGARIYFAAPKLEQASLCFDAYYQMIQKEPTLDKMVKKRRTDVYVEKTNSSAKPLAFSAKKSDGLNISLCVADEFASWAGDLGLKFYEVIKSSFGARLQPLLLSISTAGYISEGVYDELVKRCTRVLLGASKETRLAPFFYMIDDPTKWNDINELRKSNPNLGVSVTVDYLLEEIAIAEGSLSKKVEFKTKYCNVKQNSSQAWLSEADVQKTVGEPLRLEDFRGCYAVTGIDLSRTTDLTAAVVVIEKKEELYVIAHFWLPGERIEEATQRDGLPYDAYIQRGLLSRSGDNIVDYHDCEKWIIDLVRKYKIYPLQNGYDRYNAAYLTDELKAQGFHMDDVFQGYNLTPVIREAEGLFKDGKIHVGDNDLLKVHFLNTALKFEAGTERVKLEKMGKTEHIDGMAALMDALTVRQKWASEIGRQLKNARAT